MFLIYGIIFSVRLCHAAIPRDKGIVVGTWESAAFLSLEIPKSTLASLPTDSRIRTLTPSNSQVTSITSDPRNKSLLFYEALSRKIYSQQNFNIWQNTSFSYEIVHDGISSTLCQIAFDFVTNNIFWTDDYFDWISVKSINSKDSLMYNVIVHEDLNKPEAIAIDPVKGYIFFVDNHLKGRIERAYLNGLNRRTLVSKAIGRILSITVDANSESIFWADHVRHTIERVGYDGRNRRILQRKNSVAFTSIHFYENTLHLAALSSSNIIGVDSSSGIDVYSVPFATNKPFSIHVYDAENIKTHSDPCSSNGCQHMCVNTPDGPACLCQEGFALQPDRKSCKDKSVYHERGILVSNLTIIIMLEIQSVNALSKGTPYISISSANIVSFVADAVNLKIYYIDGTRRELRELNIVTTQIQTLTSLTSAKDLKFDWISNALFWIESSTIKSFSLTIRSTSTLYSGLNQPQYLTNNPHSGKLFWVSGSTTKSVVQGHITGTQTTDVLTSANLNNPFSLLYDVSSQRLYWADGSILKSSLENGTDIKSHAIIGSASAILIYKDHMGWLSGRTLSYSRISTTQMKISAEASFTLQLEVTDLCVFDSYLQKDRRGTCHILNGGCEDICVPTFPGRKCECDFGLELQPDGISCDSKPLESNFLVVADYTHNRLLQVDLTYGNITKLDITANSVLGITLDISSMELFYSEITTRAIYSINLNGQTKSQIFMTGFSYAERLAIDYSTGNLFYTSVSAGNQSYIGVIHRKTFLHKTLIKGLYSPRDIALYPAKGILFWTAFGNITEIGRCFMDGTSKTYIATTNIGWPNGLTIDYKADKLYWTDGKENRIEYSDLNGANRRTLLTDIKAHLMSIVLYGDYLYYTAWNRQKITKVDKNSGIKDSFMQDHPELGRLDGLDVYPGETQKVSSVCKRNNGLCSTFCLATPSGRTCGCQDGVSLLNDFKTCTGVQSCQTSIPNGNLVDCPPYYGQSCQYKCSSGFRTKSENTTIVCQSTGQWSEDVSSAHPQFLMRSSLRHVHELLDKRVFTCNKDLESVTDSQRLTCMENGTWDRNVDSLCRPTEILCPASLPKAILSPTCNRSVGILCTFSCIDGYEISPGLESLICNSGGSWNRNLDKLCRLKVVVGSSFACTCLTLFEKDIQCICRRSVVSSRAQLILCPSAAILNGQLHQTCNRTIGEECTFTCNSGYESTSPSQSVICKSDSTWNVDLNNLCKLKVELCPLTIRNGALHPTCNRTIGEACSFSCNDGFIFMSSSQSLVCKNDATWNKETDMLCKPKEILCPASLPKAILSPTCNRSVGILCTFSCISGYEISSGLESLLCNSDGSWNQNLDKLCSLKVIQCPLASILNGQLLQTCNRTIGEECTFICNSGYESTSPSQSVICKSDSTWNVDLNNLCKLRVVLCPLTIPNGELHPTCNRTIGEECSFSCNTGFVSMSSSQSLVCKNDATWNMETNMLCIAKGATLCPWSIPHATLSSTCARTSGATCSFACNSNYVLSPTETQNLRCTSNGTWDRDINSLCKLQNGTPSPQNSASNTMFIGVGVGGVLLLIIIIVFVLVYRRHQKMSRGDSTYEQTSVLRNSDMNTTYQEFDNSGYMYEESRQSGVYEYIKEDDNCGRNSNYRDTCNDTYSQPEYNTNLNLGGFNNTYLQARNVYS